MEAIHNINVVSLYDTLVSLITAFILGGLIGLERQSRQNVYDRGLSGWPKRPQQ